MYLRVCATDGLLVGQEYEKEMGREGDTSAWKKARDRAEKLIRKKAESTKSKRSKKSKSRSGSGNSGGQPATATGPKPGTYGAYKAAAATSNEKCFKCHATGHKTENCPKP